MVRQRLKFHSKQHTVYKNGNKSWVLGLIHLSCFYFAQKPSLTWAPRFACHNNCKSISRMHSNRTETQMQTDRVCIWQHWGSDHDVRVWQGPRLPTVSRECYAARTSWWWRWTADWGHPSEPAPLPEIRSCTGEPAPSVGMHMIYIYIYIYTLSMQFEKLI